MRSIPYLWGAVPLIGGALDPQLDSSTITGAQNSRTFSHGTALAPPILCGMFSLPYGEGLTINFNPKVIVKYDTMPQASSGADMSNRTYVTAQFTFTWELLNMPYVKFIYRYNPTVLTCGLNTINGTLSYTYDEFKDVVNFNFTSIKYIAGDSIYSYPVQVVNANKHQYLDIKGNLASSKTKVAFYTEPYNITTNTFLTNILPTSYDAHVRPMGFTESGVTKVIMGSVTISPIDWVLNEGEILINETPFYNITV